MNFSWWGHSSAFLSAAFSPIRGTTAFCFHAKRPAANLQRGSDWLCAGFRIALTSVLARTFDRDRKIWLQQALKRVVVQGG